MEIEKKNIKPVNNGMAKQEMFIPAMLVFAVFGGLALGNYLYWPRDKHWIGLTLNALGLILFAFLFYFYRDPERKIAAGKNDIVCPADGKIVGIEEVTDAPGVKGKYTRISIFLNAFNVHIQRMPFSGKVVDIKVLPGLLLPAFHKNAGSKNRQNIILIKGDITAVVKQIAGVLVHRPIAWVDVGEELKAGDRLGMITFGSRVELFVPASSCTITAEEGDIVKGGTTLLGKYINKETKNKRPSKKAAKN